VVAMRRLRPDVSRPFRTPWVWLVGPLGMIVCLLQMVGLPIHTWMRLLVWLVIGLVIYFTYGWTHSRLRKGSGQAPAMPTPVGRSRP